MDLLGFEVEAQTPTEADRALDARRWLADAFGVVPRLSALVGDLDAAVVELAAKGITAVPVAVDDGDGEEHLARGVRLTGPAGIEVDVIQPAPAGHHEARITEFIDSAAGLDGPPTDELAEAVLAIITNAWHAVEARLQGVAPNKVLATHLLLSQQSRHEPPTSPTYWQRSAASTLLSGFVGAAS
jgi:hypothetical protein